MRHIKTRRFNKSFEDLPVEIQEVAREKYKLFCKNQSHPSLRIEKIEGYPGVWSGRITRKKYRWTFHFEDDPETGELMFHPWAMLPCPASCHVSSTASGKESS